MRFSSLFVIACSLSYLALALPLTSSERRDDSSLSQISRDLAGEFALFDRDVDESTLLEKRAAQTKRQSGKNKQAAPTEWKGKEPARGKGKEPVNHRPAKAVVTFGRAATAKLNELGLHGKARKQAKNYHKAIVKAEMKAHGAKTGRVFHLAHKGGSDPNEKNHLTVGLYDKQGIQIKSPWAKKKELETGEPNKGLFHMYPENHKIKEPKTFTNARQKSQVRQAGAAAAAEARRKAEEARTKEAIDNQRMAGQSLSPGDKKAKRLAAKAKKAGGRNPTHS